MTTLPHPKNPARTSQGVTSRAASSRCPRMIWNYRHTATPTKICSMLMKRLFAYIWTRTLRSEKLCMIEHAQPFFRSAFRIIKVRYSRWRLLKMISGSHWKNYMTKRWKQSMPSRKDCCKECSNYRSRMPHWRRKCWDRVVNRPVKYRVNRCLCLGTAWICQGRRAASKRKTV